VVLDSFCGSGTTCVSAKLLDRNYIGIDESLDAVELAQSRIDNPIKTESNLLKKGRKSYINADQDALNLLEGLSLHAVQRNKGIDAILVDQHENTPILVRVQKKNEPLNKAVSLLAKAMKTKKSKKSILIQTEINSELFESPVDVDGLEILKSPSLQISQLISKS